MKRWRNLPWKLLRVGTYASPPGGSRNPVLVPPRQLLVEIIQEGFVYGFEDEPVAHGEGSVFCHHGGRMSVSDSPPKSYYHCFVAWFEHDDGDGTDDWPRCFQWRNRKAMHGFVEEMLHAFHREALERDVIGELVLSRMRLELERSRSLARTQGTHPQLGAAVDFINQHYAKPLSLDDVAAAAGVSVSHLHMLFREQLDESPHQYLIQKRMRIAGHALATSGLSIKAVAAGVGYANTENFCRAFRKFFGRSASEYRQAYLR